MCAKNDLVQYNYAIKVNCRALSLFPIIIALLLMPYLAQAQSTTISSGSFIVNMGVVPQTINNSLKPYGMIYDLIKNYTVPIQWVISSGKVKDGVDFTYNAVAYKGGPFIVPAEYRTAAVNARITYWQGLGVNGVTTTSPFDVSPATVYKIESVPYWTVDLLNGDVAVPYFQNAGIPPEGYSLTKLPSQLGSCDDIFVMPHAYPQWSTHSNLYFWNKTYHGSIYLSCTAGSELEDMFNPANHSQQANFLSEKDGTKPFPTTSTTTIENALWLYDSHNDGTPPYTYADNGNPFMQFLGTIDAATQNGLEQVYIPMAPGWRSTTTIGAWDPDHSKRFDDAPNHRAAIIAYGRAFGEADRGYVMIEAAHSVSRATLPANVAAQRVFFNFSFLAGTNAAVTPDVSAIPASIVSGTATPVSFSFPVGVNPNDYTVSWSASCGGSFAADPAYPSDKTKAKFTPPSVTTSTSCPITVTIEDACHRVFHASKAVTISCDLQMVTTLTPACNGMSNGTITLSSITGGVAPFNWSYGGGSVTGTGTVISGLAAGSYTVTVTSGGGAGSSKTFTVTIASNPAIGALSLTPTHVLCNGSATGSIAVATPTGGTPPYTYLWTDGSVTTQNRSGLTAGTYTVTAKDASGCTVTGSSTITQPSAISITPSITNVSCNGLATGAISLTVSGGIGPYTYAWGDGPTTQNRTGLAAGTYAVTVTDANGCRLARTGIAVTQPTAITATASAGSISCNGGTTTLTVTASGGTGTLQYSLNGGSYQAGNTFTVSASASEYVVSVKDANSCTKTASVLVSQLGAMVLSAAVTPVTCPAGSGAISMTVTGGTSPYTYKIGEGTYGASGNFTGLTAGSYIVTVKDANACTSSITAVVNTTSSLTATATGANLICNGASTGSINLAVSGGTPGYTYAWGDGPTTQNRSSLAAGTYNVTVTDSKGCTGTASSTLTQPAAMVITPSVTNVACKGNSTGAISISVSGGSSPYTYAWSDGPATQNRAGLVAGTYTLTVTDSKNCTKAQGISVTQPDNAISASASAGTILCNGGTTTLTVTASGGTGTLQYSLNGGTYQDGNTFTVSASSSEYIVTVKDANSCTKTTSGVSVSEPSALILSTVITPSSCPAASGAINLSATGGAGSFTYKIGSGDYGSSGNFTGLTAGNYTVTAKDGNGCTSSKSVTVGSTSALTASASGTNPICNTGSTGSISLTVSGGTPAYTYLWTGGATTQNLSGLAAGTYNVTVTDSKGCTATSSAVLTAPTAIGITPSVTSVVCNGNSTGAISIAVTNGNSPYSYSWSDGPTSQNRTGLAAGSYTVTVTDSKKCTQTSTNSVTQATAISASASAGTISCNGGTTTLTVDASGGTGSLQYSLNGGDYQSTNTFTVSASSSAYVVTVKDESNCTKTTNSVTVTQPAAISLSSVITPYSCSGNKGTISLTATGGAGSFEYKIGTGDYGASGDFTGLNAGDYTVTARDGSGCTSSKSVTVSSTSSLSASAAGSHPLCNTGSTGSINLTVSGGTPGYTYEWGDGSPAVSTQNRSGLAAGTYSVTVMDTKGCTATASATLTAPAVISIAPTPVNALCHGTATGSISLVISGGSGTYTYSWSDGPATRDRTGLTAGTYYVTVTDSKNCAKTSSGILISQPDDISLSATSSNVACFGRSTGAIDLADPTGGTAPYSYSWGGGVTTQDRTGLAAGTYIVTVTDSKGCTATISKSITQTASINLSAELTHEKCASGTVGTYSRNGAIVLTVTNGTAPYTYSWTGPSSFSSTSKDISSLKGGDYTVVVTDASGCTATAIYTIRTLNSSPIKPTGIK